MKALPQILVLLIGISVAPQAAIAQVQEFVFNPSIAFGGRSVAVTVHPSVPTTAIEAAEGGGLYRSVNGGASWSRIDSFPMFRMEEVKYGPSDGNLVVATARDDGRATSQGGVWLSTDSGVTWARAAVPYTCGGQPDAWGIGMARGADVSGLIFVATDCGVAFSRDGGANWSSADPSGGAGRLFYDVTAIRTGAGTVRVYACGQPGVYTATFSTAAPAGSVPNWVQASTGAPASGGGRCQIVTSPLNADVVFLTRGQLHESDDRGATWTQLNGPTGANRSRWVATTTTGAPSFDLYWGSGVVTFRQPCTNDNNPATLDCFVGPDPNCANAVDDDGDGLVNEGCPAGGPGAPDREKNGSVPSECKNAVDDDGDGLVNDGCPVMERSDNGTHADPSGMAFHPVTGCPLLMSNDGGIGRSTDCGATWADANVGRHALQIYDDYGTVRGPGATETDLYFGTQDNDFWYTLDGGQTWTDPGCCEGWLGQVDRRVPPGGLADIRMTYVNAAAPRNSTSTRGFGMGPIAYGNWPNPPGGRGVPMQFGNQRWGQISWDLTGPPNNRLYIMQPETAAQCANAADDDGDGAVNDGCPAVGAAETGAQCHDALDSDGDGVANDGCSHIWSRETGAQCGNLIDEDGDGVANDSCPAGGPDGDGNGRPDPETGAQCLNAVDDDGDGLLNDGCPSVGVWGVMGPSFAVGWSHRLLVSGPAAAPTFYFTVATAGGNQLARIRGPLNATAAFEPASGVGADRLRDIGRYCGAAGTWLCPRVVAVDPSNPLHLYAADTNTNQMKFSVNGGNTWSVDQELTDLVTRKQEFRFDAFGGDQPWIIAWDPENSQTILVGTEQAGLVASVNGGADWFIVPSSADRIALITHFFFDQDHDLIYASTYGRGLWTIRLPKQADVQLVSKTDAPDPVTAGRELTYQITVRNNGPDIAPNVKVTDSLPAGVTYVSDTDSCVEDPPGTLSCSVGDIPSGGNVTFDVTVEVDPGLVLPPDLDATITNTATVSSPIPDPVAGNNQGSEDTTVEARLHHYVCYGSKRRGFARVEGVQLDDHFGPGTVDVRKVKRFCAPASKDGQDVGAVTDPEHFVGYKSRQRPRFQRQSGVRVLNQFGTFTLDVGKVKNLGSPAAKNLAATPPPLADPLVDHFKCHKVRRASFDRPGTQIQDQFGALTVRVRRAVRLCSPAEKDGGGIIEPQTHLLCFKARSRPRRPAFQGPFFVRDSFIDGELRVRKLKNLCVPSVILP